MRKKLIITVRLIKSQGLGTAGEFANGKMAQNTKVTGKTAAQKLKENFTILTETFMKVTAKIKLGEWNKDKAHGYGKFFYSEGAFYKGEWLADEQHGCGYEHWPGQGSYQGEYINSMKEGEGLYKWSNGDYYQGQFKKNTLDGKGK